VLSFSAIQTSITPFIFHLFTDASDHQLGAVIMQDKKSIDFIFKISIQLKSGIQLSAIETCKEYKSILLGYHQPIIVFTGHKNNTFNGLKALYRVLCTCWLLLLEEYAVTFEYLPGKKNVATFVDNLSRLDIDSLKIQENK
jgi:hypothetical protein